MDLGLSGKRALVTGGSRGIGKAAEAAAAELSAETGGRVIAFRADTGKEADVKRLVAETAEALGGLDILVNNPANHGDQYRCHAHQTKRPLHTRRVREGAVLY